MKISCTLWVFPTQQLFIEVTSGSVKTIFWKQRLIGDNIVVVAVEDNSLVWFSRSNLLSDSSQNNLCLDSSVFSNSFVDIWYGRLFYFHHPPTIFPLFCFFKSINLCSIRWSIIAVITLVVELAELGRNYISLVQVTVPQLQLFLMQLLRARHAAFLMMVVVMPPILKL